MAELMWRTSSYSDKLECVEVALNWENGAVESTRVRDSKHRGGGQLAVSSSRWRAFVHAVRTERFGG